jgi:hypothetical protein
MAQHTRVTAHVVQAVQHNVHLVVSVQASSVAARCIVTSRQYGGDTRGTV